MTRVFSDDSFDRLLEQKGYVVLPLLDPDAVSRLAALCEGLPSPVTSGFHATIHAKDVEFRRAVFSAIATVMEAPLRQRLPEYRLRLANFIVKEAGRADSEVAYHQDWAFVDETRFVSLNVWCPLVDVGPDNGCLHMVPGTHGLSTAPRADADGHPFKDILPKLRKRHVRALPMTAGQAAFYDGRLLHGSPPNRTNRRRVSVGCVMVPAEAKLLHTFRVSPQEVEQFEVDEEFYFRHLPGTHSSVGLQSVGRVTAPVLRQYSKAVLTELDGR